MTDFCDFCKRNFPESDLRTVYTILNGVEQRERVCDGCEDEARQHEAPAAGGGC